MIKQRPVGMNIYICTWLGADDVKEKCYPEALAALYHGIEYGFFCITLCGCLLFL